MSLAAANYYVALGVLILQIVGLAFLALFFLKKKFPDLQGVADFLRRRGLWIGLALTLGAMAASLYYSEILGILPCGLCWIQRIFLYPQVVLFVLAIWKKDSGIADYIIGLSILGALTGLYQHYIQMGGENVLPCPAVTTVADCAQRFMFEFGYITFPFAVFVLFAFLIILMFFVRSRD
ncbi:MAG TPA: disulfide bond formation protein B [Candidatus Paceibacterota bacterium]